MVKVGDFVVVNATERLVDWVDWMDYLINNTDEHEVIKVEGTSVHIKGQEEYILGWVIESKYYTLVRKDT